MVQGPSHVNPIDNRLIEGRKGINDCRRNPGACVHFVVADRRCRTGEESEPLEGAGRLNGLHDRRSSRSPEGLLLPQLVMPGVASDDPRLGVRFIEFGSPRQYSRQAIDREGAIFGFDTELVSSAVTEGKPHQHHTDFHGQPG